MIVVGGEITTDTYVDIPKIARQTVADIGYTRAKYGFDAETCSVLTAIDEQSPDIAQGVDTAYEARHIPGDDDPLDKIGAGDQGMMFGYATRETKELMPMPIQIAHTLARRLSEVRKADVVPYLRPDGKTQVTVRYENGKPIEIVKILISTQHKPDVDSESLIKPDLWEHVVEPVLHADYRELYTEKEPAREPAGEPDRQVRDRRADGRRRAHRPQDHRRHLRRRGAPRRRRVLRQGPVEGRPLGRLRGALRGEERGRRRAGGPLRGAGRIRDRRRAPAVADGRDLRHRARAAVARSSSWSTSTSTCARERSSATSTCAGRSSARRPPTATSAATTTTSRGRRPTRRRR